jgi:hypothetical protein
MTGPSNSVSSAKPAAVPFSSKSRFNYNNEAGFYPCRSRQRTSGHRYRRFETAAEALRFAIEELPSSLLRGSVLEVDEARFDGVQMQALYDGDAYPLTRRI